MNAYVTSLTYHDINKTPVCYSKPVLNSNSKIDKTKLLETDYHLMQVQSIAECCEHSAIILTCILISLEKQFLIFFWVAA